MKITKLFVLICVISLNTIIAQVDRVINPYFPPLGNRYLGQKPPGLIPELFAPGIVSTEAYLETVVTFLPDMRELYFE
jgi:hypothetical protein